MWERSLAECIKISRFRGTFIVLSVQKRMDPGLCRVGVGRSCKRGIRLAVSEVGWLLGDVPEELHCFYTEGETLAVFALVHVEAG